MEEKSVYPHIVDFDEMVNELFDVADFSKLKYDYKDRVMTDPKARVVVNQRDGHYCKTAGQNYHILQHRDIYHLVNAIAMKSGLDAVVTVPASEKGDNVVVKYLFRDIVTGELSQKIIDHGTPRVKSDVLLLDDGLKGVRLGVKFKNSYDSSTAFRGSGYFVRLICTNGMMMRQLVPEMVVKEIHTHDILTTVGPKLENFLGEVFAHASNVEQAMTRARERKINFIDGVQRETTIIGYAGSKKHGERIDTILQTYASDPLNPTNWDVYDAFTRYATHGGLSPTVQENIESISEMFLMPTTTVVPVVLA